MEPYEGTEPYIFMSYARKDWERVKPFLDALSNAGYRLWWDKGISAGADWLDTLLEKVEKCAVFCPLFSEAFTNSRYCAEETKWAYRKQKNIVPLHLEEVKQDNMPRLYQLLQALQDIRLYKYADTAEFTERLAREPVFAPCKEPEWNKIGQIQWRLSADGVLTITMNEDMPKHYRSGAIPEYQYDPVHECSTAPWMPYRKKIHSVEIEGNIYTIGGNAFDSCKNLMDVHISGYLFEIGHSAFRYCKSMTDVCISDGMTLSRIGDYAFDGCESLTNMHIPDGVTKIGNNAFKGCYRLKAVRIPDSVTTIGNCAFCDCHSLKAIRISDNITEIGVCAFYNCYSLIDVRIPDNVTKIEDATFYGCTNLINVHIPDQVTEIGENAFWGCISLKNVRIPDNVTQISAGAFCNCYNLSDMLIPDSVTVIGNHSFSGCKSLKSIQIPARAKVADDAFPEHTHVMRWGMAQ